MDANEHDPVANLHMQPVKGILKSTKSIDDAAHDAQHESTQINQTSATGMTRSESKSHKIPHFDEMNIIATYHPPDKDYGHMKIEEPKTPYAPNDIIDEEMDTGATASGIDPLALAEKLNESKSPSSSTSIRSHQSRSPRKSIDDTDGLTPEEIEHRKQFEEHRKQHYNEFEVVRLRRKEIEEELRALEREEQPSTTNDEKKEHRTESIKPILVHHPHSRDSSASSNHHVHVEDDHQEDQTLTPEERERKKQFELKRKKHYNEFRAARMADKDDDDEING